MTSHRISCLIPSSPYLADQTTNPPLGLLSIAAVLRELGHEVSVSPLAITPWDDGSNSVENAQKRVRVFFEFLEKTGRRAFRFWLLG